MLSGEGKIMTTRDYSIKSNYYSAPAPYFLQLIKGHNFGTIKGIT